MALFRKHEGRQVLELPVDALAPNPNQPRKHFSQEELNELADSISQLGVMQPLTVRRRDRGWELIAGERRWRAAQLAGLSTVPCLEVWLSQSDITYFRKDEKHEGFTLKWQPAQGRLYVHRT